MPSLLTSAPLLRRYLIGVIIALFVSVGFWLNSAYVQDVVQGHGRIIPQQRTQQIQHLEGGIIEEILVEEGARIEQGQALFRIQNIAANVDLNSLAIDKYALLAKQSRLEAHKKNDKKVTFSAELKKHLPANALQTERNLFAARSQEWKKKQSVLKSQEQQKKLEIQKLTKQANSLDSELEIAKRQMTINLRLHARGAISESKSLETQARVKTLETRQQQLRGQIPVSQAELAEVGEKQQQLAQEHNAEIESEISEIQIKLQQIRQREKAAADRLKRTTISSPITGIINRLYTNTTGAVVQPGAVLADITPSNGSVVAEGRIRPQDRGRVWLGQKVSIRVSAYDFSQFGALFGTLEDISSDSLSDNQNNTFYRVRIKLESKEFNENSPLLPGMTVDFHIQAGKRSLVQILLAPVLEELWFSTKAYQIK